MHSDVYEDWCRVYVANIYKGLLKSNTHTVTYKKPTPKKTNSYL